MKYRIYGRFTGNTGDKSESIPWPFISIRASCVLSAWRITRTINTKPWWKWCSATRIPSRGSVCSAITSCWQSRPWRPVWPAKAWRSLSTHGWNKYLASVLLVKPPCGWKKQGHGASTPSSRICTIKSVACQTIPHLFFSINKTRSTDWKSSLCFGFIGRRRAWRSVDFAAVREKCFWSSNRVRSGFSTSKSTKNSYENLDNTNEIIANIRLAIVFILQICYI